MACGKCDGTGKFGKIPCNACNGTGKNPDYGMLIPDDDPDAKKSRRRLDKPVRK